MQSLGWTVFGIEFDAKTVKIASKKFGNTIHYGSVFDCPFEKATFDAIILNNVIEHVTGPQETLKRCCELLKPGGQIVLLTPNGDSLAHKRFGVSWRGLEPPRHTHIFSSRSLTRVLVNENFKLIEARTYSHSARWIWIKSYLIQKHGRISNDSPQQVSLILKIRGRLFQFWSSLCNYFANTGEELFVLARKES